MDQAQTKTSLGKIFRVGLVLTGIGTFAVIIMGIAIINASIDNKITLKFLELGKNAQPNFETSLTLYTESTKDIINYLLGLRPENEEEYIEFISTIEKIAQDLSININIQSYEDLVPSKDKKQLEDETINYQISFWGGITDLNSFLSKIEALPYFIKVTSIDFKDPEYIEKNERTPSNIIIRMKLYIKKS